MKKVLRPMLRLYPVIAERANDFEFHRPSFWNKNVWNTLRFDSGVLVAVALTEMLRNELRELRFAIRPCAELKLFERDAAAVYGADGVGDIINELLHF
jgi:hypothetical protein